MKFLLLSAAILSLSAPAIAQTNSSEPIEITAVETVEWLRAKQQYVARKDVIVTQGTTQIFSDLLTADYRKGATSSTEIWQLTAEGSVRIKDETNTAYGDLGIYDVTKGIATLTGKDLKLVSPDQTVTARDRMEYYSNERMAKAIGNAVVVRPTDTLKASVITAYFKDNAAATPNEGGAKTGADAGQKGGMLGGSGNLDRLEAEGNVIIITPTETLYGSKAIYRADANTAELTGKVRVESGENVLEGQRATVDLTTNVSKMYGSEKEGGRVRGVFFPGSEKSPAATPAAPKPPAAAAPALTVQAPAAPKEVPAPAVSASPPVDAPAKVSPSMQY